MHERTGFSLGELAYTFFAYSAGFSFGPSNVDLHIDRSLSGLAQFAPSILSVAVIFATLLVSGIWALSGGKWQQGRTLCLYVICLTIGGTALYALGIIYRVRYTAVAFPFFCVLIGAGLDSLWRKKEFWGATFTVGVAFISGLSIYNYFENTRYFNPDIRSAIAYWRQVSDQEPLISNSGRIVTRYIDATDRKRFYPISSIPDLLAEKKSSAGSDKYQFFHVLISRDSDWDRSLETQIRKQWKVVAENRFAGAVLISIIAEKRKYL